MYYLIFSSVSIKCVYSFDVESSCCTLCILSGVFSVLLFILGDSDCFETLCTHVFPGANVVGEKSQHCSVFLLP